jgi:CubicO group peptidase (beta-lactamase class C family)
MTFRTAGGGRRCRLTTRMAGAMLLAGGAAVAYLGSTPLAFAQGVEPVPACETNLKRQLTKLDVPGLAVAIVKDGRIVCSGAAGMANIEENIPVTSDTLFMVASVSKTITATALMQLHEQGKFQLKDDINDYLPFAVRIPSAPEEPITFRQLMTHTASIRDNGAYIQCPGWCGHGAPLNPFVTKGADSPISLADFTKGYFTPGGAYYDPARNFEPDPPGTVNHYCNMGIVLVGYLVEILSGTPFDAYTSEHVFKPLGMGTTSWKLAGIDRSRLAMPYDKNDSGYVPYGQYGEPDYPDGMLRTSANELARFLLAYMEGGTYDGARILKPKTVKRMLKRQTRLDKDQGLVWYEESVGKRTVWGHDGSDNGASAKMWFDPERNEGVIVMANGVWDNADKLVARLFEEADDS